MSNSNTNIDTQNANSSKNYFELITKHYKAIIATIAAAIPILGTVLTFMLYLHDKSYLEYFGVSENWVSVELSKSVYNLIYKGCIVFIMLLPNTIALAPLLLEKETRKKVKFEFRFTVVSAIIIGLIFFLIKERINLSYSKTLIALVLCWIMMFGVPVITSIIIIIINLFYLIIVSLRKFLKKLIHALRNPKKTIKKSVNIVKSKLNTLVADFKKINYRIIPSKIAKGCLDFVRNMNQDCFFQIIANIIDRINRFNPEPIQKQSTEKEIENKNKALYLLLVILISGIVCLVLFIGSLGMTKAEEERSFSVIKLSTTDMEQYDDLKPNSNGESPYIQLNKRKVNAKVVLSENDENYLVVNAYIDETENGLKLYLFSNEQTVKEKNDVIVYKIELSDKNNKVVIP